MDKKAGEASTFEIGANIVDIFRRRIFPGIVAVKRGRIESIREAKDGTEYSTYLIPGFVDAHIHIESSMLVPTEFARLAVVHGTVATVSDPHEIANVLGVKGVEFMLENAGRSPLKVMFGAPPCVPATKFETSGAALGVEEVRELLKNPRVGYLAEVMNYPGVITGDAEMLAKIECAKTTGKPVDGHAPGLKGQGVEKYFSRGITTDHECFTLEEAEEKLEAAPELKILIREGSAAKNFAALHPLIRSHPERVMFCSDDRHPNDLEEGHINEVVKRAVGLGYDVFDVLRAACVTPVAHYGLPVGLLRVGDAADFVEVRDLKEFAVMRTFIDGNVVAKGGRSLIAQSPLRAERPNKFNASPKRVEEFAVLADGVKARVNVIEAVDGALVTGRAVVELNVVDGRVMADSAGDVLKMVVVNRYEKNAHACAGFIRGFRIKTGAIASSVAHDSHNVVAVGASDEAIVRAVNLVIAAKGGLALVDGTKNEMVLPLPVGGIMTDVDGYVVAEAYRKMDAAARELAEGAGMSSPFMTLSFMALLVIPSLKLSDKGLFDGEWFGFVDVVAD